MINNFFYKYGILILLISSMFYYVFKLKSDYELLEQDYKILKNDNTILVERVELVNKKILSYTKNINSINYENKNKNIIFDNHDLKKILNERSELMERKINKAILKSFERFEQ